MNITATNVKKSVVEPHPESSFSKNNYTNDAMRN